MIEARFPARRTVMVSRGKSWYASDVFVCMLIHVPWVNINRMTQGGIYLIKTKTNTSATYSCVQLCRKIIPVKAEAVDN